MLLYRLISGSSRTTTGYPVVTRNDAAIRAYRDDVLAALGNTTLIDVRSPQEYTGERTHMPDYPEEGALRGGHIPTALSVPWAKAADDSGRFRSRKELDEIYEFATDGTPVIAYCRIGERSSHTWFVLTHLLGVPGVRNYEDVSEMLDFNQMLRTRVAYQSDSDGVAIARVEGLRDRPRRALRELRERHRDVVADRRAVLLRAIRRRLRRRRVGGNGRGVEEDVAAVVADQSSRREDHRCPGVADLIEGVTLVEQPRDELDAFVTLGALQSVQQPSGFDIGLHGHRRHSTFSRCRPTQTMT